MSTLHQSGILNRPTGKTKDRADNDIETDYLNVQRKGKLDSRVPYWVKNSLKIWKTENS